MRPSQALLSAASLQVLRTGDQCSDQDRKGRTEDLRRATRYLTGLCPLWINDRNVFLFHSIYNFKLYFKGWKELIPNVNLLVCAPVSFKMAPHFWELTQKSNIHSDSLWSTKHSRLEKTETVFYFVPLRLVIGKSAIWLAFSLFILRSPNHSSEMTSFRRKMVVFNDLLPSWFQASHCWFHQGEQEHACCHKGASEKASSCARQEGSAAARHFNTETAS